MESLRVDLPAPSLGAQAPWLECRVAGPVDAPVIVFLHGFPEAAFAWDELIQRLCTRWRCVAPNLRGYPGSYSPPQVDAYRAQHVSSDVVALIQGLGAPVAALVAHDWGGAIAWNLAAHHPRLMQRLIILNSPHPTVFLHALQSDTRQQAASEYMNFLCRDDAEAVLAANDFEQLWTFFTRFGGAAWLTPEGRERYRRAWQHGLRGPLNYYRASPLRPPGDEPSSVLRLQFPPGLFDVRVPTHVIWGEADTALLPVLLDNLGEHVQPLRITRLPGASHWLLHEATDEVADLIAADLIAAERGC